MSTPIIPHTPFRAATGTKEGRLTRSLRGGHYWTRKPPLRGSLLPANLQRSPKLWPLLPIFDKASIKRLETAFAAFPNVAVVCHIAWHFDTPFQNHTAPLYAFHRFDELYAGRLERALQIVKRARLRTPQADLELLNRFAAHFGMLSQFLLGPPQQPARGTAMLRRYHESYHSQEATCVNFY